MARTLEGLKVLEFSMGAAGPWIGRHMAYCGAEVIKVESKSNLESFRLYVPVRGPETGIQPQLSPWFAEWNAGKRFVALNLTDPRAVTLCKRLVARCDVVIENYRPGVMEKLGLSYADLRLVKPDIIMLSSSGFGDSGPYRDYATWGPNIESASGIAYLTGFLHRDCTLTHFAHVDLLSALHGLFAVMCALGHRFRTGQGQYINLSQAEVAIASIGELAMEALVNGHEPEKIANGSPYATPHGCYRCKGDDRWCVIEVSNDAEWQTFCRVLGKPEWTIDPRFASVEARLRNVTDLDRLVEEWTVDRDPYDVMLPLQEAGIAAAVVQNAEDLLLRDKQLQTRHFFEEIDHLKKGRAIATGLALGLSATPGRTGAAGQAIGQDTDYVFGELLGLRSDEIDELISSGAIQID